MKTDLVERSLVELNALNRTARDIAAPAITKVSTGGGGLFQTADIERYRRASATGALDGDH
jgi:hypothetical protein